MLNLRMIFASLMLCIAMFSFSQPVKNSYDAKEIYQEMELNEISYAAFEQAINGVNTIADRQKEILTFVDFSKPSTQERMYVIDLANRKLLYKTHVAHGLNSGQNIATSFSNRNGSHKSSLGFYLTAETYQGGNGYSLRLDGLEEGINDNARERLVVIHAAAYANPQGAESRGRLGRSFGCPALPTAVNKPIIDTIKDGSVLFIYAEDPFYAKESDFRRRMIDVKIDSKIQKLEDLFINPQQNITI